jgi:beta-lactamase superfamily II metal-dependent hydrolase
MGKRLASIRLYIIFLIIILIYAYSSGQLSDLEEFIYKDKSGIPDGCSDLEVHVLNVSEADAIFIRTPGNKTILIDAGSAMKKNSASAVVSFLDNHGIASLDYVIATHLHEDHIGGMKYIIPTREIGTVYTNGNCVGSASRTTEKFLNYSKTENFKTVSADLNLRSDGCMEEAKLIVAYDRPKGCFKNENDNSILLRIVYGNTSFLFTGDCEEHCEKELMSQNTELTTQNPKLETLLKIGHHGSSTSSGEEFLSAIDAQYLVLSTDWNRSVSDRYFHPRLSTMEKLYGEKVYRTDLNGDIKAVSDGSKIMISSEAKADECEIFKGYTSANLSSYSVISKLKDKCG